MELLDVFVSTRQRHLSQDDLEAEGQMTGRALTQARTLRVVRIADLLERLKVEPPEEVLRALARTDDLLSTVSTSEASCALVSYRQEATGPLPLLQRVAAFATTGRSLTAMLLNQQAEPGNVLTEDGVTLDGEALLGIIEAARGARVDALYSLRIETPEADVHSFTTASSTSASLDNRWLDVWCYLGPNPLCDRQRRLCYFFI